MFSFTFSLSRKIAKFINLPPRSFLQFCAISLLSLTTAAQQQPAEFNDGIDRSDPNFVTASLLIMSPGNELYSCAGHSCIRLECPTFNLDYCFSYESEQISDKIFTFFMGKLKMGMFAIPTADYLKLGRESGRGVMQYRLNLPPDVKQRLWKILDDRVSQGACLPYDYIRRGCAQADLVVLREALSPLGMQILPWPPQYWQTRREFLDAAVSGHPWNRFFLHAICGTEIDWNVSNLQKVVIPLDLLEFLKTAKINGTPIINSEGVELLSVKSREEPSFFSPLAVLSVFVVLAVTNFFLKWVWMDWAFLAFQSLCGFFFTYMVVFSNLPATDWNWLIVPFNLLPLVFWKWRKKWALWFAGVLVLWEIGMIAYPHRLTDPAYLVLVGAYSLMYARIGWPWRMAASGGRLSPASATTGGRLSPAAVTVGARVPRARKGGSI